MLAVAMFSNYRPNSKSVINQEGIGKEKIFFKISPFRDNVK